MRYKLTIPARINALGNPSDANEGDFATISAAVDLRAGAFVEEADGLILESLRCEKGKTCVERSHEYRRNLMPLPYDGELDLLKGTVNRLYHYSSEFREKLAKRALEPCVSDERALSPVRAAQTFCTALTGLSGSRL